ncbi:MAG: putative toxin-antitoxin system toxin component, PIN family [Candidatus Dojkabacteria bacterium]|nr:MAG: putative toxin-antitoxin system toxin component, PIN family [Candidatus Dojkabacteria bacterium]
MKLMIRIVIDTNVALSGLLSYTSPERMIINYAMQKRISLIGSRETFSEFKEKVLENKRFIKVAKDLMFPQNQILSQYKALVKFVEIEQSLKELHFCEQDPDDDMFLHVAIQSGTNILITNDNHLRKLKKINEIRIITPTKFLEVIRKHF